MLCIAVYDHQNQSYRRHVQSFFAKRHLLANTRNMTTAARINVAELPNLISNALNEHANKLLANIEHSQQFLSDKLDDFGNQIIQLKSEIAKLKSENTFLKKTLSDLSTKTEVVSVAVDKQESTLDMQRRSELASNAILLGIPRLPNEDTKSLVAKTCELLGCGDEDDAIISCTRLISNKAENNPIRITFKTTQAKERLIARKRQFGTLTVSMIAGVRWPNGWTNKVFIRDELSPLSLDIFRELKTKKTSLKYRYVWPGRDGVIYVKFTENSSPIKIRSRSDLQKLTLITQQ